MSDDNLADRLLTDLKKRFALGSLTYAEAVMIEDLIGAIAAINAQSDDEPAICVTETTDDPDIQLFDVDKDRMSFPPATRL